MKSKQQKQSFSSSVRHFAQIYEILRKITIFALAKNRKNMNFSKNILYIALLASAFCACKKEEATETRPNLSGLEFQTATAYLQIHQEHSFTLNVSSIKASDSSTPGKIGVYIQINSDAKDTLTKDLGKDVKTLSFKYTPIATGDYTIYAYAYADGYYSSSASTVFKSVDPETALTGIEGERPSGEDYRTVLVPATSLEWMAENLYTKGSGISYEGCAVMDSVFGRYYTYEEAVTACPAGWRLPTADEWDLLGSDALSLMADASFMGTRLWKHYAGITVTNQFGFNAIPVGYTDLSTGTVNNTGIKEYAAFWTADSSKEFAQYRYLIGGNAAVQKAMGSKTSLALSVRCVR